MVSQSNGTGVTEYGYGVAVLQSNGYGVAEYLNGA